MDFGQNIIGDFIIGEKLGEGTFSKVCVGTHRITQEKVAIKIMSKDQIEKPNDRLRIEKEINVQKKLHHSSIIQQYCIIESRSVIYIVTEYCSGGELFDYIVSKRRLNESEACRLFQQLIAGLEYLHKQRIVHRDLKPENLLFNSKHELKIADFGLSNEYTGKLTTPCGSPCYAAPEMVTGKKYNGDMVDIWSAGVVLFTMVCGFLPFEDENQTGLFKKIAKGLYTIPTFVSAPCKDLIKSILITDPSKRFTFEMIKHHPWFMSSNNIMGKNIFFLSPGLFVNEDVIPIDEEIVKELVNEYKYDLKEIIQDVIMNKHNAITTSYYLILKKKIRNGEKSISDFSSYSELFIEYNKKSISKLTYFCNDFALIIDYYYNKLKGLFQIKNAKDTIEVDEMQISETTVPTENTPYEQVNTVSSYTSRYLNNNNTKKKFLFPTHVNKFINKKTHNNANANTNTPIMMMNISNREHNTMTGISTGSNGNVTSGKSSHTKYIDTEPVKPIELEGKVAFHTIEGKSKGNDDISKLCKEENLKKITDKIASIILHNPINSTITNQKDHSKYSPKPITNHNNGYSKPKQEKEEVDEEDTETIDNDNDFFDIPEPTPRKTIQTERIDKKQFIKLLKPIKPKPVPIPIPIPLPIPQEATQSIDVDNKSNNNTNNSLIKTPPSVRTHRQKCINTSMISDTRSNSPTPLIETYFHKKIDSIKANKYKTNKEHLKLAYHNNKQAHYSQEQTMINKDIELTCPKNRGNSFIEAHINSNANNNNRINFNLNAKRIKPYVALHTNRYVYNKNIINANNNNMKHQLLCQQYMLTNRIESETKRNLSSSTQRKQSLSPLTTGRGEKGIGKGIRYKPNITNLNKFVNVNLNHNIMKTNTNTITSHTHRDKDKGAYTSIQKKNRSFEDEIRQKHLKRNSFVKTNETKPFQRLMKPQPQQQQQGHISNNTTRNIVKIHHNQSIFNAYCKKTINEIKDIVISVIGRDVILNYDSKMNITELNCKYHIKNQLFHFILNISKVQDAPEYHLITPSLLIGNMLNFKYIFDRIKTKLCGF